MSIPFKTCLAAFIRHFNISTTIEQIEAITEDQVIDDVQICVHQRATVNLNTKYLIGCNITAFASEVKTNQLIAAFLPSLTDLSQLNQGNTKQISYLYLPNLININNQRSLMNISIKELFCPFVSNLSEVTFYGTKELENLFLCEVKHIKGATFMQSQIVNVYAPKLEQINSKSFYPCFYNSAHKTLFCSYQVQCQNEKDCEEFGKCPFCAKDYSKISDQKFTFSQFAAKFDCYPITTKLLRESGLACQVDNATDFYKRANQVQALLKKNVELVKVETARKVQQKQLLYNIYRQFGFFSLFVSELCMLERGEE